MRPACGRRVAVRFLWLFGFFYLYYLGLVRVCEIKTTEIPIWCARIIYAPALEIVVFLLSCSSEYIVSPPRGAMY